MKTQHNAVEEELMHSEDRRTAGDMCSGTDSLTSTSEPARRRGGRDAPAVRGRVVVEAQVETRL